MAFAHMKRNLNFHRLRLRGMKSANDECRHTPPEGAEEISSMLSSSKKVEVKIFSGDGSTSKPCKAMSYHGYMGIEDEVVSYISKFIKSN